MLPATLGETFTASPNYLNHPPLYYLAMTWLLPDRKPFDLSDLHALRSVNALMSVVMVACLLVLGLLRQLDVRLFIVFASMVALNPYVWSIGSTVSNDNAAFLGGAICLLGAQIASMRRWYGWLLLVAGIVIAAAVKLTAGLLCAVFASVFVVLCWRRKRAHVITVAALAAAVGVATLPYLWMTWAFGSPAPKTPGFSEKYREVARLTGWVREDFVSYAASFWANLLHHWSYQYLSSGPIGTGMLIVPIVIIGLAANAWVANVIQWDSSEELLVASSAALAVMMAIHLIFSFNTQLQFSSPPFDAVPRYYYPIALGAIPLAVAWTVGRMPLRARTVVAWFLILGSVIQTPVAMLTQ